ncbi:MAG: hypothetical protein UY31_C0071G0006 [Candidatus Wolfebacteria bacterium GW2011_GWE1_48_7]|uniref:Uncharacterized protein n=1 Tax=Candidatus Wolfebacteria bacterium GW2011_GWB1_47_1 TaxID=1619007 RepID=A0A0G4ATS6_9BACT|nr:MAG: hypothetical protein UX70_C0001G0414 [Candidatus Wolfebacteria bacterium GW2011_GWB1_47_1]KKU73498.1 MAG: hypothetical protein UX96_C0004G0028 [Candidatus Wolfebacteria bacterium GW2011_GWB1_47_243]KKU97646.1 MAG: hypothetical protein UY31_C0071G0006 [Candidatus Wolfebacteria bacterium GW2011_GWE1_48_7]HAL24537.1 hypothetical protein [Candidatus Wolfebacteria bacterium]HAS95487.1 hypothetical protein [Candidatus Wolfebacteria bacterium]
MGSHCGKKRKPLTKTQALKIHAKGRASTRYHFVLTREDIRTLVRMIQDGKGRFIEKQSNRVTRWSVEYCDITWNLVYDKIRHTLITCLPLKKE